MAFAIMHDMRGVQWFRRFFTKEKYDGNRMLAAFTRHHLHLHPAGFIVFLKEFPYLHRWPDRIHDMVVDALLKAGYVADDLSYWELRLHVMQNRSCRASYEEIADVIGGLVATFYLRYGRCNVLVRNLHRVLRRVYWALL